MSRESWRFIDCGPRPGGENMALDEALLESHASSQSPPVLRVYTWRPPAISLGRFQSIESSVDLERCRALGIDVVRRPTGGRAILHTEEEVTFSIVVSRERLGTKGVMDSYRILAQGITAAVRSLGLDARLVDRSAAVPSPGRVRDPACFAVKARCDLVVGSAKLIGSAQVQRNGFILQQNSLPLRIDPARWRDVFLRSADSPPAIGLWQAAGQPIPYSEVAVALRRGFEDHFGVQLADSLVSDEEWLRATEIARGSAVLAARDATATTG